MKNASGAVGWCALFAAALMGCSSTRQRTGVVPATAPATTAATTEPAEETGYALLDRPSAAAPVAGKSFDRLWATCERVLHDLHFRIDRRDYRNGILTTYPLASKQFFEFWRHDALGAGNVAESSLATIRRTAAFRIERHDDGTFSAVPHVKVERYSAAERRMTSVATYRSAFRRQRLSSGTPESDRGVVLPERYWYSIGHDAALEKAMADAVSRKLRRK